MVLDRLDILNFKNIEEASLDFSPGVNCLLGSNGMGKSNLLEAIHFACMARPMSSMPETGLITHGQSLLSVNATFSGPPLPDVTHVSDKVSIGIIKGKGKTLKCNGKEYDRISHHIGRFPVVCVTPSDSELVRGPAQERRRLIDMTISQADSVYLSNLIRYNRSLESRNNMLRAGMTDPVLFESVEAVMAEAAAAVSEKRRQWIETIAPVAAMNYKEIAGGDEELKIAYLSSLTENTMTEILDRNRAKDTALGYTSAGIHRDDLVAYLNSFSFKSYGSQGQIKSFTIALRLAIFEYMKQTGSETPILLLDDIFDKLDSNRVGRIMQLVSRNDSFGQIFITDTNREHLDETLAALSGPSHLFLVDSGKFNRI